MKLVLATVLRTQAPRLTGRRDVRPALMNTTAAPAGGVSHHRNPKSTRISGRNLPAVIEASRGPFAGERWSQP
jgi:hypothetical protein